MLPSIFGYIRDHFCIVHVFSYHRLLIIGFFFFPNNALAFCSFLPHFSDFSQSYV